MVRTSFPHAVCEPIRRQITEARSIALFLDFDGTLVPIHPHPEDVQLDPDVRSMLTTLIARCNVSVSIVSGREMWDLRRRVGVPEVVYAGEHGMEIRGPGIQLVEPAALARRGIITLIAQQLTGSLRDMPGVFVEAKHLTIAVHYRHARRDDFGEIKDRVRAAVETADGMVELRHGKMVWEILPRTGWRKGSAVQWIYRSGGKDGLPIYIGDDEADEDAFADLTDWITIRVGQNEETAARCTLAGPEDVGQFLIWLILNRAGS